MTSLFSTYIVFKKQNKHFFNNKKTLNSFNIGPKIWVYNIQKLPSQIVPMGFDRNQYFSMKVKKIKMQHVKKNVQSE